MGIIRVLGGIIVLTSLVLLSPPTQAQDAMLAFACVDRGHAEVLASEMTDNSPPLSDERWASCLPVGKPIGDMSDAPPPILGPLQDWEGDRFALYQDGSYLIVYGLQGYHPDEGA